MTSVPPRRGPLTTCLRLHRAQDQACSTTKLASSMSCCAPIKAQTDLSVRRFCIVTQSRAVAFGTYSRGEWSAGVRFERIGQQPYSYGQEAAEKDPRYPPASSSLGFHF